MSVIKTITKYRHLTDTKHVCTICIVLGNEKTNFVKLHFTANHQHYRTLSRVNLYLKRLYIFMSSASKRFYLEVEANIFVSVCLHSRDYGHLL